MDYLRDIDSPGMPGVLSAAAESAMLNIAFVGFCIHAKTANFEACSRGYFQPFGTNLARGVTAEDHPDLLVTEGSVVIFLNFKVTFFQTVDQFVFFMGDDGGFVYLYQQSVNGGQRTVRNLVQDVMLAPFVIHFKHTLIFFNPWALITCSIDTYR